MKENDFSRVSGFFSTNFFYCFQILSLGGEEKKEKQTREECSNVKNCVARRKVSAKYPPREELMDWKPDGQRPWIFNLAFIEE